MENDQNCYCAVLRTTVVRSDTRTHASNSQDTVIYTTIKITSEFKNVSVTVGVVDGLALHATGWRCTESRPVRPRVGASTRGVIVCYLSCTGSQH